MREDIGDVSSYKDLRELSEKTLINMKKTEEW